MRARVVALIVLVGVLSIQASAQTLWSPESETGPSPRRGAAMAYDDARGVMVLFGGFYYSENYFGETWEWDGQAWTIVSEYDPEDPTTSPSPRYQAVMAYDNTRGVTVLHGGHVHGTTYDGTWEWDGVAWTKIDSAGGPARTAHAMVYDSTREVMVMFGGTGHYNDTWEYDGSTWTQRCSSCGPSARELPCLAYDVSNSQTILFGGQPLDDGSTWAWDGEAWSIVADTGPAPCAGHSMVYDSWRKLIVLFGGGHWTPLSSETWEWNGTEWCQASPLNAPPARWAHSMAFDTDRHVTVLFGGVGESYTNPDDYYSDTWFHGPDCNSDGTQDYENLEANETADCNGNGILDVCDIPGDLNGDGYVDLSDLASLLANYGACVYQACQ